MKVLIEKAIEDSIDSVIVPQSANEAFQESTTHRLNSLCQSLVAIKSIQGKNQMCSTTAPVAVEQSMPSVDISAASRSLGPLSYNTKPAWALFTKGLELELDNFLRTALRIPKHDLSIISSKCLCASTDCS